MVETGIVEVTALKKKKRGRNKVGKGGSVGRGTGACQAFDCHSLSFSCLDTEERHMAQESSAWHLVTY